MSETPQIPIVNKPMSMMDVGPNGNNLAAQAQAPHPVDFLQQQSSGPNLDTVRHVYGIGLAMRLQTEQKIAQSQPSYYREIVSGTDDKLDFGDLFAAGDKADGGVPDLHKAMERELGM